VFPIPVHRNGISRSFPWLTLTVRISVNRMASSGEHITLIDFVPFSGITPSLSTIKNTLSLLEVKSVYSAGMILWLSSVNLSSWVFKTSTLLNSSTSCLHAITGPTECAFKFMVVGRLFWPIIRIITGILIEPVLCAMSDRSSL